MSNEEIKVLMLELTEHLNEATAIIQKLHTNYLKDNYNGPEILNVRISRSYDDPFKAEVQCGDLLEEAMQAPMKIRERNSDVYPFKYVSNINGVEFFELCNSRSGVQINEVV